jgi:hypothetical protein
MMYVCVCENVCMYVYLCVVEACAELGTHYCDITGEIHVSMLCVCVICMYACVRGNVCVSVGD